MGQQARQALGPTAIKPGQTAISLMQGLPPLRCRFGSDEISNALRRRQIHLAMQKGAARELTGLCLTQTSRGQCLHHARNDAAPAMHVQFRCIFAGIGRRARKPNHQGMVQGFIITGTQAPQACPARRGQAAGQALQRIGAAWAG